MKTESREAASARQDHFPVPKPWGPRARDYRSDRRGLRSYKSVTATAARSEIQQGEDHHRGLTPPTGAGLSPSPRHPESWPGWAKLSVRTQGPSPPLGAKPPGGGIHSSCKVL